MNIDPDHPSTWFPVRRPHMIAHDVGRSRDRSTAVVGGLSLFQRDLLGIAELNELPQGLFGNARANALAAVDARYGRNAVIIADLSYDPTYAQVLHETFGRRVIGLHICSSGDGSTFERREVGRSAMSVYHVGRSYLLELLHARFQARLIRMEKEDPMSRRAYQQLMELETEMKQSGTIYKCASGQHDDLGMSCAMLAWAASHKHFEMWCGAVAPVPPPKKDGYGWGAFV